MGILSKVRDGFRKTREGIKRQVGEIISNFSRVDEDLLEELEEKLILSDVGVKAAGLICSKLREKAKKENIKEAGELKATLEEIVVEILGEDESLNLETKPSLILVVGVNGVGKTTSIGKIAFNLKDQGKSVIVAAADTFRAAAINQLEFWAKKAGADIVKQQEGSDPAAVVFDTIYAAKSRQKDVIICDTAGRLHNKKHLMLELEKISRIIKRELPESRVETLLILDATTGQNAISQAREFKNFVNITGIILTKLDGTAKGGIVIAIKQELDVPVKLIGVGEKIDDLQVFSAKEFVNAIFSE
ncbi:MAG: signal recognition particle-docking protein FtsY [Oscillospiraceae bacterium]|nr:signal recognition particle-docking protein FtsY [Oscillospiraceae bacterium]